LLLIAVTTATSTLVLLAFVVLVDPFSVGRLTPLARVDIVSANRIYANAGRIRDPRFDAAVFGNSHAVRIHPERLGNATGRRFVTLAINAMDPSDQALSMKAFDRAHSDQALVFVVVLDDFWCAEAPLKNPEYRLPRWLYGDSTLAYVGGVLSPEAVRGSFRRLKILAGYGSDAARPDGYQPGESAQVRISGQLRGMQRPTDAANPQMPFPVLDQVERTLAQLRPEGAVLLVFTPAYAPYMQLGTKAAERLSACKARARAIAQVRPRTALLDLRVDGPKARNEANFIDATHYGDGLARDVEAAMAERLNALLSASGRP